MISHTKKYAVALLTVFTLLFNTAYSQTYYNSQSFGLKMLEPAGWQVGNESLTERNLEKFKFSDQQYQKLLASHKGTVTLKAWYKYPLDSIAGLIPTVKIILKPNPAPTDFGRFKQIMLASIGQIKTIVKDFKFIGKPQEITISGYLCLVYHCRYSFNLADGTVATVRNKMYMISKGKFFININMMDGETNEDCSALYAQLGKSIRLSNIA